MPFVDHEPRRKMKSELSSKEEGEKEKAIRRTQEKNSQRRIKGKLG